MTQTEQLQKHIAKLIAGHKKLEERITQLERKLDHRKEEHVKHVLGFGLSNVKGYFHAVKSVNGEQLRVYVGKDNSEENVRKKIINNFVKNFHFYKDLLKHCDELAAEPEIAELLRKEKENLI